MRVRFVPYCHMSAFDLSSYYAAFNKVLKPGMEYVIADEDWDKLPTSKVYNFVQVKPSATEIVEECLRSTGSANCKYKTDRIITALKEAGCLKDETS